MDYFKTPDNYQANRFGPKYNRQAHGAPLGQDISSQTADLLNQMVTQLGLKEMGVYTPWGGRMSDFSWKEVDHPDTNTVVFNMTDELLAGAQTAMFGAPIPFLVILTPRLPSKEELDEALDGSNYELFQTIASYRQDDPNPIPAIYFVNWVRLVDDNEVNREVKSMSSVATRLGGSLMYGQQVPVEGSTVRAAPEISFQDALEGQFGSSEEPSPPDSPIAPIPTDLPPIPTTAPTTTDLSKAQLGWTLLGVGVLAGAGAYYYYSKKKR